MGSAQFDGGSDDGNGGGSGDATDKLRLVHTLRARYRARVEPMVLVG